MSLHTHPKNIFGSKLSKQHVVEGNPGTVFRRPCAGDDGRDSVSPLTKALMSSGDYSSDVYGLKDKFDAMPLRTPIRAVYKPVAMASAANHGQPFAPKVDLLGEVDFDPDWGVKDLSRAPRDARQEPARLAVAPPPREARRDFGPPACEDAKDSAPPLRAPAAPLRAPAKSEEDRRPCDSGRGLFDLFSMAFGQDVQKEDDHDEVNQDAPKTESAEDQVAKLQSENERLKTELEKALSKSKSYAKGMHFAMMTIRHDSHIPRDFVSLRNNMTDAVKSLFSEISFIISLKTQTRNPVPFHLIMQHVFTGLKETMTMVVATEDQYDASKSDVKTLAASGEFKTEFIPDNLDADIMNVLLSALFAKVHKEQGPDKVLEFCIYIGQQLGKVFGRLTNKDIKAFCEYVHAFGTNEDMQTQFFEISRDLYVHDLNAIGREYDTSKFAEFQKTPQCKHLLTMMGNMPLLEGEDCVFNQSSQQYL